MNKKKKLNLFKKIFNKKMSKLRYYKYLQNYTPAMLRKVQTGINYDLGRR